MASFQLPFGQRKWILKCYWKTENVFNVQRCRWNEFGTPLLTQVTITRLRDKFETDGTVQNVNKARSGKSRISTNNESIATVLQTTQQWINICPRYLLIYRLIKCEYTFW